MSYTPGETGSHIATTNGFDEESGEARIADPGDFTLRRRLRQLHDAKEAVKETKNAAVSNEVIEEQIYPDQRDHIVAERVTDYIHELRPVLAEKSETAAEEFLSETVEFDGEAVTLQEIMLSRGRVGDDGAHLPYYASMQAWDICNGYFERIAGAVFEPGSAEPETNLVDPSGRFEE